MVMIISTMVKVMTMTMTMTMTMWCPSGYMCAWLNARLLTLDIHGGTTEAEIVSIFHRAKEVHAAASAAGKSIRIRCTQ
jgi:hypothetical protein